MVVLMSPSQSSGRVLSSLSPSCLPASHWQPTLGARPNRLRSVSASAQPNAPWRRWALTTPEDCCAEHVPGPPKPDRGGERGGDRRRTGTATSGHPTVSLLNVDCAEPG